MRLLIDSDAFCKLAIGGVLDDAVRVLGADLPNCGRLAALPHMLRRGKLRRTFGPDACDSVVQLTANVPVIGPPGDEWLDKLTPVDAVDPGEAQIFASAAESGLIVLSGDKRALQAMKAIAGFADALSGRIVVLEAIFIALCDEIGSSEVSRRVQPLIALDKVIQICFSPGNSSPRDALQRAASAGIIFTPVTGISRSSDVDAAMNHQTNGLAIRLTRSEFEKGGLAIALRSFVGKHELVPENVDLIVDLGEVDDLVLDGVKSLTNLFLEEVPDHDRWRTFTISACAFPPSMGKVERHDHAFVERLDWIAWRSGLHARRQGLPRLPTFSDCAIQNLKGIEDFDFRTMQVSAAIRYTRPENWLLIKGESTKKTPPGEQFPVLANRLVYGSLRQHFAGENHCEGCRLIKAAADGAPKLGSAGVWRRLGTIHHIAEVMDGLTLLSWP